MPSHILLQLIYQGYLFYRFETVDKEELIKLFFMQLSYRYSEYLKESCVEEDGYYYYMPISYILLLQNFCEQLNDDNHTPVNSWYSNLKDIERKIVVRKPRDDEKRSSIW